MRVLHIGKYFPPHPGGIERCCADLCSGLVQHGVRTAVLAHAEPGTHHEIRREQAGIDLTLAACHGVLLHTPLSPLFVRSLARTIKRFQPDLLHLHVPNPAAFYALRMSAAERLPWVVHWHADIPLDTHKLLLRLAYRAYRPWEQALLRRAAAVIATSQPYLDASEALAPWRAKTQVIPLGVGPAVPATVDARAEVGATTRSAQTSSIPMSWPAGGLRILAVGRLSFFKGFDVLLRAVRECSDASLVLIGDGECRDSLRRLAAEMGMESRVRFVGRIDMDAAGNSLLLSAYAGADVFCLPSIERAESFGLVLLEAMRAGLPVIASAIAGSGVGYVVRDEETGLLVPPKDVSALTHALRRLAADPGLRARLGAAGAARFSAEFTLDQATGQVLELYRSILGTTPGHETTMPAGSPNPAPGA